MRQHWKLPLALVCLLALASLPLLHAPRGSAQSVTYTVTDIGAPGGAASSGYGLDDCGKVVGEFEPAGQTTRRPFLWAEGTLTDIGSFGGTAGRARGVNTSGAVTGSATTAVGMDRPFVWTAANGKTDLGTPSSTAVAFDINEAGLIVGQVDAGSGGAIQERAFVWTSATGMQFVAGASWGTPSAAYGVNDAGHVVGTAQTTSVASHAFHLSGGVLTEIGALGGANSFAFEVNESGVVVGYANTTAGISPQFHAFRWTAATNIQDLGTLGGTRSQALDVNDAGVIVGFAQNAGGASLAFIWKDDNGNNAPDAGEMKDLNVVAPGTGWTFQEARAINDRGQIVGVGVNPSGQTRAFLLTPSNVGPSPCDAPPTPTPTPTPVPVPGALAFNSATYTVSENGGAATITVSRTGGDDGAVSVNYATSNGTATAGGEYTATSGTLNWADGDSLAKSFTVAISNDTLDEPNKTVNLSLSSPGGGASLGAQAAAVLTINDDDATPTLKITGATVTEGTAASTVNADFAVTLSAASAQTVTVLYNTVNGSATAGADYVAQNGTLTFNPGQTSKTVTVVVNGDDVDEPNENFIVSLSSPTNAGFAVVPGDTFAAGGITDDDGAPALSITGGQTLDVAVTEGHAGTTDAVFTVNLLPASGQTVTVSYATSNGTAAQPLDYTAQSNTLTFDPGQTSKTVTVKVNGDTTPEAHEDFFVTLSNPTNADLARNQAKGTINNDDTTLTIGGPNLSEDPSVAEGNTTGANTPLNFTVRLSHVSINPVTVNYSTSGGTATAGTDYTAVTNATLNIPAGSSSGTAAVQVIGDRTFEADETFNVTLSNASTGATIGDATAVGTILNDEAFSSFQFSVPNYSVSEGEVTATITVTRTGSTAGGASVNYATSSGFNNPATAGSDYTAVSGTLNFAENDVSETFTIPLIGDTLDETDETVNLTLSSPVAGSVVSGLATLTITDNDEPPTFTFDPASFTVAENVGKVTVTVKRTGGTNAASVLSSIANSSTATKGSDFTLADITTLNFAQGETSKTFDVVINNDTLDEPTETVNLFLSPFSGTQVGAQGTAVITITDDDSAPTIAVTGVSTQDVTVHEGVPEEFTASFKITLSAASGQTVTVNYATANGTATASTINVQGDYTAASGSITFNAGETEKFMGIHIADDAIDEPTETFFFNLSGPANATISDAQAVGTIVDDEGEPLLRVSDVFDAAEGNAGTVNATFTVTLSAASAQPVTVNYATQDGPALVPFDPVAVAGADYNATSGTLTFQPGQTEHTVNVPVRGDLLDEFNEKFSLNLSGAVGAIINDAQGTAFIADDDAEPSFSVGDATVTEGNFGVTLATFTITLSAPSGRASSVHYSTADGTASMENDYTFSFGTPVFEAGETSKTLTVPVHGDTADEPHETFFVNLDNASLATIADGQGLGTITNDDSTVRVHFSQASYAADESAHFVTVTVSRTGPTGSAVSVDFATSDGTSVNTATERRDYTAALGTLHFAADETSKTFDVLLTDDHYPEPNETIILTLSNPVGGSVGAQSHASVVIAANDNPAPTGNPVDFSPEFVRQHYHDFLNREPDASGLGFWTNEIESCGSDAACREVKRINVSAAFFLSIEFQETGYLAYRTYKTAFGDATSPNVEGTVPVIRLNEFLKDSRRIGEGVVVGPGDWQSRLEANKQDYMLEFTQSPRFLAEYPLSMSLGDFIAKLRQNAGVALNGAEQERIAAYVRVGPDQLARAGILQVIAESEALKQQEKNRAYVLMQFYGYLRRNPDDPQDTDFRGWKFWLDKLNEFDGDAVAAEMVKAFLNADEYRNRFAP